MKGVQEKKEKLIETIEAKVNVVKEIEKVRFGEIETN